MADKSIADTVSSFILPEAYAGMTYPARGSRALEPNVAQANAMKAAGLPMREILSKTSLYPGYDNEWEYVSDIDLGKYSYDVAPQYPIQDKTTDTLKKIIYESGVSEHIPDIQQWQLFVAQPTQKNEGLFGVTELQNKRMALRGGRDNMARTMGHELAHALRANTLEKQYRPNLARVPKEERRKVYESSMSEVNAATQEAIARETDKNKIADVLDAAWGYGNPYYPANKYEAYDRAAGVLKDGPLKRDVKLLYQ